MANGKPKFRPVMLPAETYEEITILRDFVLGGGVNRLPPEAREVFKVTSRVTRTATVQAAVAYLLATVKKEAERQSKK